MVTTNDLNFDRNKQENFEVLKVEISKEFQKKLTKAFELGECHLVYTNSGTNSRWRR
jgi:hypothetical protein